MKTLLSGSLLFLILAGTAMPSVSAADDPNLPPAEGYAELAELLRQAIRAEVAIKEIPAFSIALVDGDRIVWAEGFGTQDARKKVPATASTVYRVGSISKLVTDMAVMQQVEQGKLDLDAPLTQYLPDFQPENPWDKPLTLRQLMSHRTGLVRESPVGNYFDPTEPTLRETVESLNQTRIVYEPDTKTKYSNAGISVAGYVLEQQTGQPYSTTIAETLMQPLGMRRSSFVLTPELKASLASASMRTYDGRRFEAPPFMIGTSPAGNLYSTVIDLSRFLIAIFNDGKTAKGQILNPETLRLMTHAPKEQDGNDQEFAIGFHVGTFQGQRWIGHGGAVYGFSTQFSALPDAKLGVMAVSALDGSNGTTTRLTNYALELLLAKRAGKPLGKYHATSPVPPERIREVVGRYATEDRQVHLLGQTGKLYLRGLTFKYEVRLDSAGTLVIDDPIAFGERIKLDSAGQLKYEGRTYTRMESQPPAGIPDRWQGLIGEYGEDHNVLYILEDQGQLWTLIEWFYYYPLTEIDENTFAFPDDYGMYHGEKLIFSRDAQGRATKVVAASVNFDRREVGTKNGVTFQIKPVKPIEELRQGAMAATPPKEEGEFRQAELVELVSLDPTIQLDIRYATTNNFTGSKFYQQPRAFLQKPAAEAVVRAHRRLKEQGLGLLIHDAYRPWFVTKMFWDATPLELKEFVANPANGSRHNRGCAVDLTLYDLKTGEPIPMVAGYDEFSPRSYPEYPGGTSRQRWYRELLRRTMEAEGFAVIRNEWWHFDYQDWQKYRIGNVGFEQILEEQEKTGSLFDLERSIAHQGFDGETCWVHARAGAVPAGVLTKQPLVVMTMQKLLLTGSDVFYALHELHSEAGSPVWSEPKKQDTFERKVIDEHTEVTVCDFTPRWHAATGTLLGTGQTVWYSDNEVMKVRPRATAYATFNLKTRTWSAWKELEMPNEPRFQSCGAGSVQRYDLPNGDILLPVYFKEPEKTQYSTTVLRCRFDGETLQYIKHGSELTVNNTRGLYEPSITKFGDRFYLTMRNDNHGYVSTSTDGQTFTEPKRWTWDDGTDLGNYNTQQHWVTHSDALFLVYTRRGANNDHVFRHRAPLFIAQVDPEKLTVLRHTEQILVPERGARLGNFAVTEVSPQETWVTAAEWMQPAGVEKRGSDNSVWIARLKWRKPNRQVSGK